VKEHLKPTLESDILIILPGAGTINDKGFGPFFLLQSGSSNFTTVPLMSRH